MKVIECGNCRSKHVKTEWVDHSFEYGSETPVVLVARVPKRICAECNFQFTDDEYDRIIHETVCRHLGVMTPEEIVLIRNHYRMTRKEFSEISRLGEASLARWETGGLIHNGANDNYLYLLSIPANIERLQARNNQAPLALIARPEPRSRQFKLIAGEEYERTHAMGNKFQLMV